MVSPAKVISRHTFCFHVNATVCYDLGGYVYVNRHTHTHNILLSVLYDYPNTFHLTQWLCMEEQTQKNWDGKANIRAA